MRRTPWTRLLVVAAVTTVLSWTVLRLVETRGGTVLPISPLAAAVVVGLAAVVLALGWSVRQYTRGKRPGLDPLLAARTVVLATASAWTGALLTGWYGGHVLLTLGELDVEPRRALAVSAAVAAVVAVGLAVVGLVVERWCEVRPRDDDDAPGHGGGAPAAGSAA